MRMLDSRDRGGRRLHGDGRCADDHGGGADGIQAATRFAVTRESGLPDAVKQRYFDARAGGHRGQRHFADGLSDEDAQVESRDQRRAQAAVRGLRVHA